ncbi:hypothetical protein, partial [Arenimonas malthae]|uniref:hypothetical protein n=1 Tax=Arenimonas malthae TaxID=354197 RepID=UPI0012EC8179
MKIGYTTQASLLLAAGLLFSGDAAAQSYMPAGVQANVPEATVLAGGWTVCSTNTFATAGVPMATILAACSEENIMLACRPVGDPNFTLVAAAPRADVFFETGNPVTNPGGYNVPHDANGVGWYYNDSWSYGFAPQGEPLSRNSCDTNGSQGNLRMCVHTDAGALHPVGGYRCGNTTLNFNAGWEHVILQATPMVTLTVPGSSAPRLIAEELIIPPNRTVTNTGNLDIET